MSCKNIVRYYTKRMYEDIVICEMYHSDPLSNEYCNLEQISIGTTNDNSTNGYLDIQRTQS